MKKFFQFFPIVGILATCCSTSWAVKPLPTDPAERAKALEKYKQGLGLYAKGQKLHGEGKYEDANATYGRAMDLFRDGPKPDMGNSYNRLGNAYLAEEPRIAFWYYAKALSIRRQDHGREHETVASSFNNVGMACMQMKEYDRAITYFDAATNIFRRVIPKRDNGQVAAGYGRLGSAYTAKKEYVEAVRHYEKALEIFLKVSGLKHPNVARSKRDLGYALIKNGEKKKGLDMLLEAKDIFIATEGAQYVETQELIKSIKDLR
ncbi:MAG: tetratricopeptide repeat protein [Opitutales bacterium]